MIYTSYFAKLKQIEELNIIPVSICGRCPDWYKGNQYKKLAPNYKFFMEWKQNQDNDFYIEHFQKEILDNRNINIVLQDLFNFFSTDQQEFIKNSHTPYWMNNDFNIALICYEKPSDFCHRHLVADWMTKNGIPVKELIIK